jgi:GT2 family glycosyltransferase
MNPKVMICIPTAEYARRADFYDYVDMMSKPEGTLSTRAHGQSPARNRNLMIKEALKNDCTHVLFIDDDTVFPPDMLIKLLAHDKDVITGLYLMRNFPHQPIIFDRSDDLGRCSHRYLYEGDTGLVPIVNCGLGCCLIKIEVFKTMPEPWITLGEAEPDHWCDDISFFNRVRKHGFKLFCDLTVLVGHMASVTLYPAYENGNWYVVYDTNGTGKVSIPMISPAREKVA